jgi:alkylhydroperoxidase/carboxymuconolactone decarboxylase family protein YurZ
MKQTNPAQIETAKKLLADLKVKRGGSLVEFHKKIANDPALLQAFGQQYDICNKELKHLPRKYRELIIFALGCAFKTPTTINVHAKLALENGATIDEIGETLRLVFFLGGANCLIPAAEIFEAMEE